MPGFITHYICAQAVLKTTSPPVKKIIEEYSNIYNLGAQGPDIFFYYLPGLIRKRTRGIGIRLHQENPGAFIMNLADAIQHAGEKDKPLLFAYTAGYLTHYALDAAAHPFVYARSNLHGDDPANENASAAKLSGKVKRQRSVRSSVEHRRLETSIDVMMLMLMSGKNPADYKLWQLIDADVRHMQTAAAAVSAAIKKTYKHGTQTGDVYKAMRYMVNLTRLLQSNKGRRKRFMELAEDLTLGARVVTSIIHDQKADDGADHMNIKKTAWRAPWESKDSKNDSSFAELYTEAVANGSEMVEALYAFTQKSMKLSAFRTRIGNRSLKTGLTWEA